MLNFFKGKISEQINVLKKIEENTDLLNLINKSAEVIVQSYKSGCKLMLCGNGGSASDSQHLATELVSRFLLERKAIDAEALTVNTSSLTAIGNDYTFDKVFSRQVEAKGKKGDVLIAITTSGNSKNIIEAVKIAKSIGIITIGFTGNNKESQIYKLSDYCIGIPTNSTPRIQEAHILIGHMLCEYIEAKLAGKDI